VRLGGPTVIYLGGGWVLTAHHVGTGVVELGGHQYYNVDSTLTRFTNGDQSNADLIAFRIEPGPEQPPMPDLPILPIRTGPPLPGEEVVMIGAGRSAAEAIEVDTRGLGIRTGYAHGPREKRWGTNRVDGWPTTLDHSGNRSRVLVTTFDSPDEVGATAYEAGAATGDSGGAVFALRNPFDPTQGWALAGLMSTVSGAGMRPSGTTLHGDVTYSIDLSHYRDQIIALTRPECSNGIDDDGDGQIDHPADLDCLDMADPTERSDRAPSSLIHSVGAALLGLALLSVGAAWALRRRRAAAEQTP
jgi:MYXO-CTERM domain-containing protein